MTTDYCSGPTCWAHTVPAVGTFCDECGTRLSDAYGQVRACPMCEEVA